MRAEDLAASLGDDGPRFTGALSLPRHKAILTALLARDPFAAQQATLVQLKETREDLSEVLGAGQGLL